MSGNPLPNNAAFTLQEILSSFEGVPHLGAQLLTCAEVASSLQQYQGVYTDSRQLTPRAIFIALRGERFDGHEFLQQAIEKGAGLLIVENDVESSILSENLSAPIAILRVNNTLEALGQLARCHREKLSPQIIGITGSYGKTTTRAFITAALSSALNVLSTQENYNNEIGVPQTLLQLTELHDAAVIEMGMRGHGQINYLSQIAGPSVGVITNIGPQHIELLGSLKNIAAAKAELLQELPAEGAAILPADDAYFDFLRGQTKASITSFGCNPTADYQVIKSTFDHTGKSTCTIKTPRAEINLQLPFPGMHNAINAAAALAVADYCGIDLRRAAEALAHVQIPGARMQIRANARYTIIDDCYNAGPFSVRAALEVLEQFPTAGRRVAILGSMLELGEHSAAEHQKIGVATASIAQVVIGVGEETKVLFEAAKEQGVMTRWFANADAAVAEIPTLILPNDVILVKGSRGIALEKVVEVLGA